MGLQKKDYNSKEYEQFVIDVLVKDPAKRPTSTQLLEHPFLADAEQYKEDFI